MKGEDQGPGYKAWLVWAFMGLEWPDFKNNYSFHVPVTFVLPHPEPSQSP